MAQQAAVRRATARQRIPHTRTPTPTLTRRPSSGGGGVDGTTGGGTSGGVDLEVSRVDTSVCDQLYNLYHRTDMESDTYLSLATATVSSAENAKSLRFSKMTGRSLISAWCGTSSGWREVAEVEIDPGAAGTYSSRPRPGGGQASAAPRSYEGTR